MISIRPISVDTLGEATNELEKIGLPPHTAEELAPETLRFDLRLESLPASAIPQLKSFADSLDLRLIGAPQSVPQSPGHNLLLSGSHRQIEKLAATLADEPPDLREFSTKLSSLLGNLQKTRFTIPCRSRILELGGRTLIMGVINTTPDSFSDGGVFFQPERAVAGALNMVEEGADIIDIGGESTRPESRGIDLDEELRRVIPVIKKVAQRADVPVSVDTRKAKVAQEALEVGAEMVNDVSALRSDPGIAEVVASSGVPLVLMHMRGTPETMQHDVRYTSLISEVLQYLQESIDLASKAGVDVDKIVIDPGIGFGKTVDHNLAIIKHLRQFRVLGRPILIGTSRKSFIGKILNLDADEREEGTIATMVASILNGAHMVRVHNVRNAVRAARLADAIKGVSIPEV